MSVEHCAFMSDALAVGSRLKEKVAESCSTRSRRPKNVGKKSTGKLHVSKDGDAFKCRAQPLF